MFKPNLIMTMKVATIILNRNLPKVTDNLVNHLKEHDGNYTDIFVIEAGSDDNNLSRNTTWHIKDEFTITHGLRYPRGVNIGIKNLYDEDKFAQYESFFYNE